MAARSFLRDAGGIPRQGKRLFLRDWRAGSVGVPRQAKRIFERDAAGIPRLVFTGVQVLPLTVSGTARYPSAASAAVSFTSDGTQWEQSNQTNGGGGAGTAQVAGIWDPAGDGANYDIRAVLLSGTYPVWSQVGQPLNTWIQPSTGLYTASWGISVENSNGASASCVLRIDIALHGTGQVLTSGQVTLEVTDNPQLV